MARGVRVGGAAVIPGTAPRAAADEKTKELLGRRIEFRWQGERVLDASLQELGATVDTDGIARHLAAVAHEGDLFARVDEALQARAGLVDIPIRTHVPVEELAARLARLKDEQDSPPKASKLNVKDLRATAHAPGRYLDMYAAAAAIDKAVQMGASAVDLPVLEIAPRASSDVVASIEITEEIARFETRFGYLGSQAGRAQNIERAASGMDGVVILPGEMISFNANVGPRSEENGFAHAPEIYKGEMREGVGGGTCQVSGTLHAAALLGGLEIIERANHSRPSGYIRMGLDATVVYPTVDLRLRNPFDFPVVLHSIIDKGVLTFQLLGRARPVTVEISTETIGVAAYKRKVEEDAWVPEGKVVVKQKGVRGYSIKKTRRIRRQDGRERVEVSTDVYPPTFEIVRVHPGTDVDTLLPPLPGEPGEAPTEQAASPTATPATSPASSPASTLTTGAMEPRPGGTSRML